MHTGNVNNLYKNLIGHLGVLLIQSRMVTKLSSFNISNKSADFMKRWQLNVTARNINYHFIVRNILSFPIRAQKGHLQYPSEECLWVQEK